MSASPRAGCLPRIGGALALDYCNTTTGRGTDRFVEHLFDHEDLRRWALFNELLTEPEAAALGTGLTAAEQVAGFTEALTVRALLNDIFDALARGRPADPEQLAALAEWELASRRGGRLVPADGGFAWRFAPAGAGATGLLGPILRSAVTVLTGGELGRLKACPGEDCGWVFLDRSKNGSRVWCEMEVCGTRAKLNRRASLRRNNSRLYRAGGS